MHTFSNASENVTWDLGGEIYWDSSSQALLGADCLSSQADHAQLALQCKHHSQALVYLASGLFDRLHVLLNISSDAHFQSTVNISLGFCLKIRSLKISSFNKNILLPKDPGSNVWNLTVRAVDLWPLTVRAVDLWPRSCKSTGKPACWVPATSSKGIQTGSYFPLFVVVQKNFGAFQKHLSSSTRAVRHSPGQLCFINYMFCCFNNQYTYTHTHTCVCMHMEFTTAAFWKKILQLFFLWCCVEISDVAAANCYLELQCTSERQEGLTSLHPVLNFTERESAGWVIRESLSTQQGHQSVHTVQSTTTFSFAALPDRWHVNSWYQTSETLIPCGMQSDTQRLSGHAAQGILRVFL